MVGNFAAQDSDHIAVDCETCREALSAQMDNESAPHWAVDVADHLAGCADCRDWQTTAWHVTRTLRVRPAAPTPDLTAKILADYQDVPVVGRQRRPATWRWLLAAVALAQLALGVAELFGVSLIGQMSMAGSEHLLNESTSWNIALGIGFAVVAARPRLCAGLLPTLGVFLLVLTGVSIVDLIHGAVTVTRVSSHVLVLLGMVLLLIGWRQRRREPGPALGNNVPDGSMRPSAAPSPGPASNSDLDRPDIRPAGRHAA